MNRTPSRSYNPRDAFQPVFDKHSDQARLVQILLDEAASFLPYRVLEARESTAQEILAVITNMRGQVNEVIKEHPNYKIILASVDARFLDQGFPHIEAICELEPDTNQRDSLRRVLSSIRDSMTPDLLHVLGLWDNEIFDRNRYNREVSIMHQERTVRTYESLAEIIRNLMRFQFLGSHCEPDKLVGEIKESAQRMHECVQKAFDLVSKMREERSEPDSFPQNRALFSDLRHKSAMGLVGIFLTPSREIVPDAENLQRRIDALQVLEIALGYYSLSIDPRFKGQQIVQKDLSSQLDGKLWAPDVSKKNLALRRRSSPRGSLYEPVFPGEPQPQEAEFFGVRKLRGDKAEIFKKSALFSDPEYIGYDERLKNEESILIKLLSKQELVRQEALGILKDKKKIAEFQRHKARMRTLLPKKRLHGLTDALKIKPASFASCPDGVGFMFVVPFVKPLKKCSEQEKRSIIETLREFGATLVRDLGLEGPTYHPEKLFDDSAASFEEKHRDFRVYAHKTILIDGKPVRIPVEFQIKPLESYALSISPGSPVVHKNYRRNGLKEIGARFEAVTQAEINVRTPHGILPIQEDGDGRPGSVFSHSSADRGATALKP